MSHAEFVRWQGYREKRGSLHVGLRIEAGFALLLAQVGQWLGAQTTVEDFTPHYDKPETSPADVMRLLSGGRR